MQQAEVGIIGGGILALATAYHLTQLTPTRRVAAHRSGVLMPKRSAMVSYLSSHVIEKI